jgi:hypothetical protein
MALPSLDGSGGSTALASASGKSDKPPKPWGLGASSGAVVGQIRGARRLETEEYMSNFIIGGERSQKDTEKGVGKYSDR